MSPRLQLLVGSLSFALSFAIASAQPAVPAAPRADSAVTALALSAGANCKSNASVDWTFTYTVNPTREFGSVTNADGKVIGGFDQASALTGGTFFGTWVSKIGIPQPDNSLIGTYGGAGDEPPTANTAEYFILYNCGADGVGAKVLYSCSGNKGSCPKTALEALDILYPPVPANGTPALVALVLVLSGIAGWNLRRRLAARP